MGVGVTVGVRVTVAVGLFVAVGEAEGEAVRDAVGVIETVGVEVRVTVKVWVGRGVEVGGPGVKVEVPYPKRAGAEVGLLEGLHPQMKNRPARTAKPRVVIVESVFITVNDSKLGIVCRAYAVGVAYQSIKSRKCLRRLMTP
jgi:hypothetical protein